MLNKLKLIFQSAERKRLLSNFFSLSALQVVNSLLPLIVVPYLYTTLGANKFGLIVFAQVVVSYFGLFVNYGFNFSATKEISVHRDNKRKISEIYSSVTTIKFVFTVSAFLAFLLMIFNIDRFSEDWKLYLFTFGSIIESILFPVWFFQGMERMKYITLLNITAKLIFTILGLNNPYFFTRAVLFRFTWMYFLFYFITNILRNI